MERAFAFLVSKGDGGKRFDRFLQQQNLSLSRSQIKRLIDGGQFLVNGRQAKTAAKLKPGDRVSGSVPAPLPLEVNREDIPLDVLYEDPHIIVVNKAPGMVVHPAPGFFSGTLVNALLFHCKDLSGINGVLRPGIVHRLDRYTSGVIVAAKNDLAHDSLVRQFKSRTVEKRYVAVVCGHFMDPAGIVTAPLGRHPKNRLLVSVHTRSPRQAITRWRVLEAWRHFTLLEIFPKTGRTHQIRVHLSSIGHPILGDPVYSRRKHLRPIENTALSRRAGEFPRQALHATDLRFFHPHTGEPVAFHAPLAHDLEAIIEFLRSKDR